MRSQNAIWALLKNDSFNKFKIDTKNVMEKVSSKVFKEIQKKEPKALELYEKFIVLTMENYENLEDFKATSLPNDEYDEHMRHNLPSVEELWMDRDLMLGFREFLYQQYASEGLSFYMDSVNFENFVDEEKIKDVAVDIYKKYFRNDASTPLDLDYTIISKIKRVIKKSIENRSMYKNAKNSVFISLENQWFPLFLSSPVYQDCNNDAVSFVRTGGHRERSKTMELYDLYAKRKRKKVTKKMKREADG